VTSKSDHEIEVFLEFAEAAGLPVDRASVKSPDPPKPDVFCMVEGEPRYFELTRAADQGIADDVGKMLVKTAKTGEGLVGTPHWYDDKAIIREAVERKAAKAHETGGLRLDLLVYGDGVFHALGTLDHVRTTFAELQAQYAECWNALWLYDRSTRDVLLPDGSTSYRRVLSSGR
jgi:hypothetical protein